MIERSLLVVLVALVSVESASASRLEARIRRTLSQSQLARSTWAAILVTDENGRRLVDVNSAHLMTPASNTKLFSTALALQRLGPQFRVTTRVEQRGRDLFLIGAGDTNLSGRVVPYKYDAPSGPPLSALDDLAAQVAANGITTVQGDIVGDDSAFQFEPYASGWAVEDIANDDGAPVSALVVNDNTADVTIRPGTQAGAPAVVTIDPAGAPFEIASTVVTGEPKELHADRAPGSSRLRLWGAIAPNAEADHEAVAATDPASFAAWGLKSALEAHGVAVHGAIRAQHWLSGEPLPAAESGVLLASRTSPPLADDLRIIDKVSQNLHADSLLFLVAKAAGLPPTRENGLRELTRFLGEIGIPENQVRLFDGSGLSRMNLVTPGAVTKLLLYMRHSQYAEQWLSLLPVSGVDGSLAKRLTGPKYRGRILAKTGTLMHVSALSGYAHPRKGGDRIFSIFLNNYGDDGAAEARKLIDKICMLLVD